MKAVFLIDRKNLEVESFIYEDGGPVLPIVNPPEKGHRGRGPVGPQCVTLARSDDRPQWNRRWRKYFFLVFIKYPSGPTKREE
jgi:hypothetical protein